MPGDYTRDKIDNWVSDFCISDQIRPFSPATQEIADPVLRQFMYAACDARGVEPDEIEEEDVKKAVLGPVARLAVPAGAQAEIPGLCGAFLAYLETEGRLSGGRVMGAFAKALTGGFTEAASGKAKPIVNAGSKIGRNDPCPCGSGKKYKKCCMKQE